MGNDPRKRPYQRPPKEPVKRTARSLKPPPPPPEPPPPKPGERIASQVLDQGNKISTVNTILKAMDEAGAKHIPISEELMAAIPVIAGQLMTKMNPRTKAAGAKLALGAARHNLARFAEANKTEEIKVEHRGEVGTFIMPAPVIGKLGDAPKERT